MALAEILERNRAFVRGRAARPLPPPEPIHLAIVACYDPRLDALIGPALGLDEGSVFLIRSAGAVVAPGGDPLRSLALATYLFDVNEVIVLGHTSCRMATFDTTRFVDAFRGRGVARGTFGDADLRTWAGAMHAPAAGVRASVAAVRAAAILPRDLTVSGLLLDDASGELTVVVRPDEAVDGLPAAPHADSMEAPAEAADERGHDASHAPARSQEAAAQAAAPADAKTRVLEAARALLETVMAQSTWRYELQRLRTQLHNQTSPIARIALIDTFVRKAAADSREIAEALDRLKREVSGPGRTLDDAAFIDLVRRAFMGETS